MRITVKAFLTIRKTVGNKTMLKLEVPVRSTVKDLLARLSGEFGGDFRDLVFESESEKPGPGIQILLNAQHYTNLAKGIETELKHGDVLALFPPVAGG